MKLRIKALSEVREARDFLALIEREAVADRPLPAAVSGLAQEVLALLLRAACARLAPLTHPQLILTADAAAATRLESALREDGLRAAAYLPREYMLYHAAASHEAERARLSVLSALLEGRLDVVITTPAAALGLTVPRARLRACTRTLRVGDTLSPDALCDLLAACGFQSVTAVESAGQFARRGGIVDFSAEGDAPPVRVEFFGDEIDRLCYFDPLTQRISDPCEAASLFPAREVIPDRAARERIRADINTRLKRVSGEAYTTLTTELAALTEDTELLFADKYMKEIYPEGECLLSYLDGDRIPVYLLDHGDLETARRKAYEEDAAAARELIAAATLPQGYTALADDGALRAFLSRGFLLYCSTFGSPPPSTRLSGLFGFSCRTTVSYADKPHLLSSDLSDYTANGYRVILLCRSRSEAHDRTRDLADAGYRTRLYEEGGALPEPREVLVAYDGDGEGFELASARLAVLSLSDNGTSPRRKSRHRYVGKRQGAGDRILSYAELHEGDYVVHSVHGIGQFLGIETLTVDGTVNDYITLQYAGQEKLFLRADKLDAVARYIGARAEDGSVRLSRIGGTAFGNAKARAKAAARDIAKELIELYAARERMPGFAFPPEGAMEAEFAAGFEYEETEPQRVAIAEIAADMSRPVPMDRLLCGDVGFGKTEVALRAAFRAVVAGKQVAILVPTTILALQHYNTMISRMRGYPVNVEVLSRFKKPAEAAAIRRRLARGEIDIIVGTHSLLSKGVSFRDLGLLIVDEEQRFGVGQKERIKQMAEGVDVLTLTATPIPRTLNMAMNGIRDMSVLDEAPSDRFPVITYVMEHNDVMIHDAVRRELSRGGQVLYLYNRVDSIYTVANRLQEALPDARLAVAHGQMEREELESIWQSLVLGELDILVATTIIETGIDLPNANTLIIEDADRLGLAQLHQLRGRVGRSHRQAYTYCTYRAGKLLSEVAVKRLEAIREYCEFGAGFRVALRDLEIRGAGNLLGAEQHGHIDSVGYDMYVRLLSEAVLDLRGIKTEKPPEATLDLSVDAYIPESYISAAAHRIDMYKKLSLILTDEDRGDVLDEFCDRFGDPPKPVLRLLDVALSRALATRAGMAKIEQRGSDLKFSPRTLDLAAWSEAFAALPGLRLHAAGEPFVTYRLPGGADPAATVLRVLRAYCEALPEDPTGNTDTKEDTAL